MQDFRVTFSKTELLIYTSHLDLQRGFVRVFNRAGLCVKCTEGFNPHPKIVFALPLSLGMEGKRELVDFTLDSQMSNSELLCLLNANMPKGLKAIEVGKPDKKFKHIKSADYTLTLCNTSGVSDKICEFLKQKPLNVKKKGKDTDKIIEISSNILAFEVNELDGATVIDITLSASPDNYVNPECIINALIENRLCNTDNYRISRNKINFEE